MNSRKTAETPIHIGYLTFVCEDPPCFAMIHVLEDIRIKCHLVAGILPDLTPDADLTLNGSEWTGTSSPQLCSPPWPLWSASSWALCGPPARTSEWRGDPLRTSSCRPGARRDGSPCGRPATPGQAASSLWAAASSSHSPARTSGTPAAGSSALYTPGSSEPFLLWGEVAFSSPCLMYGSYSAVLSENPGRRFPGKRSKGFI